MRTFASTWFGRVGARGAALAACVGLTALGCASSVSPSRYDSGNPTTDADGGSESGCAPGLVVCNGRCTNLATSPMNCGGCGNECNTSNQICRDAVCVAGELCNGSGCSGGMTCCAERICCPSDTHCVIAVPNFMGCCPLGESCN